MHPVRHHPTLFRQERLETHHHLPYHTLTDAVRPWWVPLGELMLYLEDISEGDRDTVPEMDGVSLTHTRGTHNTLHQRST